MDHISISSHQTGHEKTVPEKSGPERNLAYLREHQAQLRNREASCNLSEVSFQTEQTDALSNSRHSSLNTEPLTLDADQIHDAKEQAVDVLQNVDSQTAFSIFTKDMDLSNEETPSQAADGEVLAQQLNALVDKAQQVVEANEKQSRVLSKNPETVKSTSEIDEKIAEVGSAIAAHEQSQSDDKKTHPSYIKSDENVENKKNA